MTAFKQVDVFTAVPYRGNPVAVVMNGEGIDDESLARFARWTNLSETTFLLPPTNPEADYRVRIFTPGSELPFAGHPTIGTCHAWLEAGGQPRNPDRIIQECGIGLVTLKHHQGRVGFAAPPLIRSGPVDAADLAIAVAVLGIEPEAVVDAQWADNGPGWMAVRLASAREVLDLKPDFGAVEAYDIGVVGPYRLGVVGLDDHGPTGGGANGSAANGLGTERSAMEGTEGSSVEGTPASDRPAIEVRAFFRSGGTPAEDPVTGSLNAALAQWLLADGTLTAPYIASQGTAMGRQGRVHVHQSDGEIWIGGDAVTCIDGNVVVEST